jgi:hypothetical protein
VRSVCLYCGGGAGGSASDFFSGGGAGAGDAGGADDAGAASGISAPGSSRGASTGSFPVMRYARCARYASRMKAYGS